MERAMWVGWTPAMIISAFIMALVSPAVAQDTEGERATLAGLTGVYVLVEGMKPDAEKDGLARSTLQTDVELKLRQEKIRVLTSGERLAAPGMPYLYLRVGTFKNIKSDMGLYAFVINLELIQEVRLTRNPAITSLGATWQARGFVGTVGAENLHIVRDDVRDQVDQFLNAYLAANPKR